MSRPKTVLIVDDEPGMARALAAVLEDAGFRVESAATGVEVMRRLAKDEAPDLILLDFLMPEKDGCATLREIRDDEKFASLPVIMMSGVAESMIRRRCGTRPYNAFLEKPFALDDLLEIVGSVLQKKRPTARRAKGK